MYTHNKELQKRARITTITTVSQIWQERWRRIFNNIQIQKEIKAAIVIAEIKSVLLTFGVWQRADRNRSGLAENRSGLAENRSGLAENRSESAGGDGDETNLGGFAKFGDKCHGKYEKERKG